MRQKPLPGKRFYEDLKRCGKIPPIVEQKPAKKPGKGTGKEKHPIKKKHSISNYLPLFEDDTDPW